MSGLESLVIDINPSDSKSVLNLEKSNDLPSMSFGGGIELLMNDKKKSTTATASGDIGIGELSELENELNNLADDVKDKSLEKNKPDIVSNIAESFNVKFDDVKVNKESNLGKKNCRCISR